MGDITQKLKILETNDEKMEKSEYATTLQESGMQSIVDLLELHWASRSDPVEAMKLSMAAIHRVQVALQDASSRRDLHVFLIASLFNMLYIHCDLHYQRSRYYEMAVSITQALELFDKNQADLQRTIYFSSCLAQIHLTIAKVSRSTYYNG